MERGVHTRRRVYRMHGGAERLSETAEGGRAGRVSGREPAS